MPFYEQCRKVHQLCCTLPWSAIGFDAKETPCFKEGNKLYPAGYEKLKTIAPCDCNQKEDSFETEDSHVEENL